MKHILPFLMCTLAFAIPNSLFSKEVKAEKTDKVQEIIKEFSAEDIKLLSQAYGHMIGDNVSAMGIELDNNEIIQGIQDAFSGAESPLDEAKTIAMFTSLQENKFTKECALNLKAAEEFLASNTTNKDIIELEKDQLQYRQITKGSGKECKEADTPIISYTGKYLNGEVFGKSEKEEPIALGDTIEGFKKAIIGMKVGEKREVYIHPNLGYGVSSVLSPNALLTFEIELKGIEKKAITKEETIGGMGDFPNEDAFAENNLQHKNVK